MTIFADPRSYSELEEIGWPKAGSSEEEFRAFLTKLVNEERQAQEADAWIASLPEKFPELARPDRSGGIGVGTTTPKDGFEILRSIAGMDERSLRSSPFKAQITQLQNEASQQGVDLGELRGIDATGLSKGTPLSPQQKQGLTRQGGRAFSINTPLARQLIDGGIDPDTADFKSLSDPLGEAATNYFSSGIADSLINKVGPVFLKAIAANIGAGLVGAATGADVVLDSTSLLDEIVKGGVESIGEDDPSQPQGLPDATKDSKSPLSEPTVTVDDPTEDGKEEPPIIIDDTNDQIGLGILDILRSGITGDTGTDKGSGGQGDTGTGTGEGNTEGETEEEEKEGEEGEGSELLDLAVSLLPSVSDKGVAINVGEAPELIDPPKTKLNIKKSVGIKHDPITGRAGVVSRFRTPQPRTLNFTPEQQDLTNTSKLNFL